MNTISTSEIRNAVAKATQRIAPLWPLSRFVAVNPFAGFLETPFDTALDLQGLTKSGLVAWWSGAKRRIGFKGEDSREINLVFAVEIAGLDPRADPPACEDWITFRWVPVARLGRYHLEPWPLRKLIPGWLRPARTTPRWAGTL